LFNPIIPIHFSRTIWALIDLTAVIIFAIAIFRVTEHSGNYLVYGERGLDCLEMALHPYAIHWERSKQKIQKEYLNFIESGEIIAPSYSHYLTQAIHNFTKAIKLNPKCATSYFNRAYSYLIRREFQKAADDYTKMIELNPQDVDTVVAYFYRGCAYRELGEVKKALSDYNKAMELDPENSAFYKKCIENLEKE
jgi:tetratricopeptide (TPR) repeat protein